jgi:hypothetical protein
MQMPSPTQDEEIDRILKGFRGDIIQSTHMYGENIYSAQDHAQSQAKTALHRLMLKERREELLEIGLLAHKFEGQDYHCREIADAIDSRIAHVNSKIEETRGSNG